MNQFSRTPPHTIDYKIVYLEQVCFNRNNWNEFCNFDNKVAHDLRFESLYIILMTQLRTHDIWLQIGWQSSSNGWPNYDRTMTERQKDAREMTDNYMNQIDINSCYMLTIIFKHSPLVYLAPKPWIYTSILADTLVKVCIKVLYSEAV